MRRAFVRVAGGVCGTLFRRQAGWKAEKCSGTSCPSSLAIDLASLSVAGAEFGDQSIGAGYIEDLSFGFLNSSYQDIFAFVILGIVLIFRPTGLLGERVADRA